MAFHGGAEVEALLGYMHIRWCRSYTAVASLVLPLSYALQLDSGMPCACDILIVVPPVIYVYAHASRLKQALTRARQDGTLGSVTVLLQHAAGGNGRDEAVAKCFGMDQECMDMLAKWKAEQMREARQLAT